MAVQWLRTRPTRATSGAFRRLWLRAVAGLAAGIVSSLLQSAPAHAHDEEFAWSFSAEEYHAREVTLYSFATARVAREGDARFYGASWRPMIGYSLSKKLFVAQFLDLDQPDGEALSLAGTSLQLAYNLADGKKDAVGLAVQLLPRIWHDRFELEGRVLISKAVGSLRLTANLIGSRSRQFFREAGERILGFSTGVGYFTSKELMLGVEGVGRSITETGRDHTLPFSFYLGPTLHWAPVKRAFATMSFGFELLEGARREVARYHARVLIGLDFGPRPVHHAYRHEAVPSHHAKKHHAKKHHRKKHHRKKPHAKKTHKGKTPKKEAPETPGKKHHEKKVEPKQAEPEDKPGAPSDRTAPEDAEETGEPKSKPEKPEGEKDEPRRAPPAKDREPATPKGPGVERRQCPPFCPTP